MKRMLFLITLTLSVMVASGQTNCDLRNYIDVTGSAEMEIDPDEITLIIGLEEYWKEEFDSNAKFKNYKTKIQMAEIEKNLLNELNKLGISGDKVIVREIGNYWRHTGKEFLIKKEFEITVNNFTKVSEIANTISTRGIDYMSIGSLKHKNISEFRKQVKTGALKAAKDKAEYLLSSVNKKIYDIISIEEVAENNYFRRQDPYSNLALPGKDGSSQENFRKIKLRYEMKVRFEFR